MKSIIFDLDGTLIDSSPGILASFSNAFTALGMMPQNPVIPSIIGPPLKETLCYLSDSVDTKVIDLLASEFKAQYDSTGFMDTVLYDGIKPMLDKILSFGIDMYIATNKRALPTEKILHHFKLEHYFKSVYALDSYSPEIKDKSGLLKKLISDFDLNKRDCIYVGDRDEDAQAAEANSIAFYLAGWGFGGAINKAKTSPLNFLGMIPSVY